MNLASRGPSAISSVLANRTSPEVGYPHSRRHTFLGVPARCDRLDADKVMVAELAGLLQLSCWCHEGLRSRTPVWRPLVVGGSANWMASRRFC